GDGSKRPAFEVLEVWDEAARRCRWPWKHFQQRQPTRPEIRRWFKNPEDDERGIAIIAGAVSGGLEILDLDSWDVVEPWSALAEERAPGLLDRLVRVKTPRPGMHIYFRSEEAGPSMKLARTPIKDPETGRFKPKVLIEVKGEAGYCLAPGSPGTC